MGPQTGTATAPPQEPRQSANKKTGSRWYTWLSPDGQTTERYWSVTTIIKLGIPSPALIEWAAKITAVKALDNLDTLYHLTKKGQRGEAISYLREERFRVVDRARITGAQAHEAIEAYKLGRPFPGVPDDVRDYYEAFLRMLDDQAPHILQTEAKVFNRTRRYAGQLDSIAVFPKLADRVPRSCPSCRAKAILGEGHAPDCATPDLPATEFTFGDERGPVLVVDYKTGKGPKKGGVYPDVALQLAAYDRAEFIGMPDGTEHPLPLIDGAVAIHLQPGWSELVPVHTGEAVWRAFLHAYEVARWQEEVSKGVIGRPIAVYELEPPEVIDLWEPKPRRTLHHMATSRVPKEGDDLPRHAVTQPPKPAPKGKAFLALCGVAVRHVTDKGFDPIGRRVCPECGAKSAADLAAYEAKETHEPDEPQPQDLVEPQPAEPVDPPRLQLVTEAPALSAACEASECQNCEGGDCPHECHTEEGSDSDGTE